MKNQSVFTPFQYENLSNLPRKEARKEFERFLEAIPDRLVQLEHAVRQSCTPQLKKWQANFEPESLILLGEWFLPLISKRIISEVEMQERESQSEWLKHVALDDWSLSDLTFSLCLDIGIYYGETLIKNTQETMWQLHVQGRRNVDYHKPIINRPALIPINPVSTCMGMAFGYIRRRDVSSDYLYEAFKESLV